jgi:hypothetical protein
VVLLGMIGRILGAMSAEPIEMATIPRVELDAMKAELRRLQLAEDRAIALARMKAHARPEPGARTFASADELAQAMGLRG